MAEIRAFLIEYKEYGDAYDFLNLASVERSIHQTQFNPFWLGWEE